MVEHADRRLINNNPASRHPLLDVPMADLIRSAAVGGGVFGLMAADGVSVFGATSAHTNGPECDPVKNHDLLKIEYVGRNLKVANQSDTCVVEFNYALYNIIPDSNSIYPQILRGSTAIKLTPHSQSLTTNINSDPCHRAQSDVFTGSVIGEVGKQVNSTPYDDQGRLVTYKFFPAQKNAEECQPAKPTPTIGQDKTPTTTVELVTTPGPEKPGTPTTREEKQPPSQSQPGGPPARLTATPEVPLVADICESTAVRQHQIPLVPDDAHPGKENLYTLGRQTGVFTGGPEQITAQIAQEFFDYKFAGKSQAEINQMMLDWQAQISARTIACMVLPARQQPPATATVTLVVPSPTEPPTPTPVDTLTPTPFITNTPVATFTPTPTTHDLPVQIPGAEGYLAAGLVLGSDATALPLLATLAFAAVKSKFFKPRR